MDDLSGKTAFITGSASGIGLSMARAFAAAGAKLVLADINGGRLNDVASHFEREHVEAHGVVLDVADIESWKAARESTLARFGTIDILCNNAGVAPANVPFEEISDEDWDWIVGVNMRGVRNGITTWLPEMKQHGRKGHIVNTASVLGLFAASRAADYVACKYAVVGMSEALHMELAGTPIGVSVLCPGFVKTGLATEREMHKALSGLQSGKARPPSTRLGDQRPLDPDHIGRAVVAAVRTGQFLILPHPEYALVLDSKHERMSREYHLCPPTGEDVAALGGGELNWS